jgi:hypothetical protein
MLYSITVVQKEGARMTEHELEKREKVLRMAIERTLPDFVKACTENGGEPLLIHQDGFAADYDEYELLGMAIKSAGLYGTADFTLISRVMKSEEGCESR